MSTHNIGFHGEIRKKYGDTPLIWSYLLTFDRKWLQYSEQWEWISRTEIREELKLANTCYQSSFWKKITKNKYFSGFRFCFSVIVLYFKSVWCWLRWLIWMRRPTGDQEVAGSTPAEVGNILSWRLIMKYFLQSFSPFRWFKKGSCQFLAKECAQYWLTA